MAKIVVIGMGQGGVLAGGMLAKAGFDVAIYEKSPKGAVSHDWHDDIRFDIFEICGIAPPSREHYTQKSKWLFVSPDEKNSLKVPPARPMEEVSVSRRGLGEHLVNIAVENGAKVFYDTPVDSLVLEGDRVVGVKVGDEVISADLVIDASGLNSPFRGQIPTKFGVPEGSGKNGIMRGWRGFFVRNEEAPTPDPESTLYIKHLDGVGISWCNLNDRNEVDVLIGRIGEKLTEEEQRSCLEALRKNHPILTDEMVKEGKWVDIGVRCTAGGLVADGYVLVGDSAFMTMPIMGSGIEASMKAGKWLVEHILEEGVKDFTAANLWGYQVKYFDELGADYVFIDVVKRWALNINPKEINWLFGCGAVTNDDMALLSTDTENPVKLGVGDILKKVGILLKNPRLIGQAIKWLLRGLRAKSVANGMPEKYDIRKVQKWQKKYDDIIAKIERGK